MAFDPITAVNLVLSLAIFLLAIAAYVKRKHQMAMYIGIAFALFALSHLLTLLGMATALTTFLIIVRTLAYLVVIYALLMLWKR